MERIHLELPDGTPIVLRALTPADATALARGFRELSPASRHRRFLHAVRDLNEKDLAYLTAADGHHHIAVAAGILDPEADAEIGLGVAHAIRYPEEPRCAELAVTVVDRWHGRGVGRALVTELVKRARAEGIEVLRGVVFYTNTAIQKLMHRLGPEVGRRDLGEGVLEIDVSIA